MYNPDKIFIRKVFNIKSNRWEKAKKARTIKRVYNAKLIKYGKESMLTTYSKKMYSFSVPNQPKGEKRSVGKKREDNIQRARTNLYRIAKANEDYFEHRPVFLTLTFDPQLFPFDYLTKKKNTHVHFKSMIQLLRNHGYKPEYITIYEQHKSGNYHIHTLLFNMPFLSIKKWRSKYWKHGYIDIKLLADIENTSAYFVKYMKKDFHDNNELNKKLYYTSRGLNKPQEFYKNDIISYYMDKATKVIPLATKIGLDYSTKIYKLLHD